MGQPPARTPQARPHSAPDPRSQTPPTVLIIDDDQGLRAALADILGWEGYRVMEASHGQEALRILDAGIPSLILLDMRMPVLNGWEFARELQRRGVSLPIIVMTAAQDAQRWADEIGATGCLPKPFDLNDLLVAVKSAIDHRT